MGTAIIKIKLMPASPETNLREIEKAAEKIINKEGTVNHIIQEPIAFGLKAVIITFALNESKELDPIEEALGKIKNVNSTQIIDMRRAVG